MKRIFTSAYRLLLGTALMGSTLVSAATSSDPLETGFIGGPWVKPENQMSESVQAK